MKVLVAEDDSITLHLLQALLQKASYEPVTASDGAEALEMLAQPDCPRLVILDWMMPLHDGVEVCRAIRKEASSRYIYLILLTAKDKQTEIIQGLEAGADDYITKPFDFHELMARLRTGKRILDLQDRLIEEATHDSLTGLMNRAEILEILRKEINRSARKRAPVSVLMADIDHFKEINDTHGHWAGDIVLREVAARLRASLRSYDSIGRYGGEEFLIAVPGCDTLESAQLAERLRQNVAQSTISDSHNTIAVTLSFGVAGGPEPQTLEKLLRSADKALYAAKQQGRNCVRVFSEEQQSVLLPSKAVGGR